MTRLWTLGMLAVCLSASACGSEPTGEGKGGGGSGGSGGGATTTTTTTTAKCPTKLPDAGTSCETDGQSCDYPNAQCATTARCGQSYEADATSGELTWHHEAPKAAATCTKIGQFCKFTNAAIDSETAYDAALCSATGWVVTHRLCGNGNCAPCPAVLPTEGASCDPGAPPQELTYEHCTYAVQNPCGYVIASLSCDAGTFTIATEGCE